MTECSTHNVNIVEKDTGPVSEGEENNVHDTKKNIMHTRFRVKTMCTTPKRFVLLRILVESLSNVYFDFQKFVEFTNFMQNYKIYVHLHERKINQAGGV